MPQQDLKRCLNIGASLTLTDQDRVEWMMQSPKLREWLNSPDSRTLLLNSDVDPNEMFSPTTFVSAKLLESLSHIEPVFLLYFFCSLHTSSSSSSSPKKENQPDTATGLLKTLISQLLLRSDVNWDLSSLPSTNLSSTKPHQTADIDTLSLLFRSLIYQLPPTTFLFCMIDGINYYERSERRRGFLQVVHSLLDIIHSCSGNGVVIKLLLTCPGKSLYVKDLVSKEDILTVPPTVDGSRQGWSERAFQKTLGDEIGKLDGSGSRG